MDNCPHFHTSVGDLQGIGGRLDGDEMVVTFNMAMALAEIRDLCAEMSGIVESHGMPDHLLDEFEEMLESGGDDFVSVEIEDGRVIARPGPRFLAIASTIRAQA